MKPFTPSERAETTERVAEMLKEDQRIEGAVFVGSTAGGGDRWSDIDIDTVIDDDVSPQDVAADWVKRIYEALPVLHHFETAFGDTPVRGFLLENLLELDLAFTRGNQFEIWGPARLAFDRSGRVQTALDNPVEYPPEVPDIAAHAGIGWHDVLHAYIALKRGRRWQSLWYLERVRSRALALAAEQTGLHADFFDQVDSLPAEELDPLKHAVPRSLDDGDLLTAIGAATRGLLAQIRKGDPGLADRLEEPLLEFVAAD